MSGRQDKAETVYFDLKTSEEIVRLRTSMDNLKAAMRDHEKILRDAIRLCNSESSADCTRQIPQTR